MGTLSLTDPVNGTANDATTIANNNAATKAVVNGGIDNTNINASAGIALTKLGSVPTARVFASGNLTTNTSSASYTINWDSESFDNNTFHSNTTNTSRLSIPTTGVYAVSVRVDIQGAANTAVRTLQINKNGSPVSTTRTGNMAVSSVQGLHCSDVLELSSGDYLEATFVTAGTSADTLTGGTSSTWMTISFLGNQ